MSNELKDFNSIAVSGQACSGKSTICKLLAELLRWQHVNIGTEIRKLANIYGFEIENFGSIPPNKLRKVDQEIIQRIHKEPHVIWDGRLACYLSRDIPSCFRIFCTLPIKERSKRLAKRENILLTTAEERITNRDIEENNVFKRLYGLSSPCDSKWINLIIDTSDSSNQIIKQILEKLGNIKGKL